MDQFLAKNEPPRPSARWRCPACVSQEIQATACVRLSTRRSPTTRSGRPVSEGAKFRALKLKPASGKSNPVSPLGFVAFLKYLETKLKLGLGSGWTGGRPESQRSRTIMIMKRV